ncbi:non-ribosomal peptide synthetase, partial [Vallitalea longa]|uniref:non-ribosomal peptide synthetase n=1 Tax=Vallitalea longa TaxID=2936439 RepID=UPI0024915841
DTQVKIQGHRIELGEIEARIKENSMVKDVAVVDNKNKYDKKYLCAYVVAKEGYEARKIKKYIAETLPKYMIPSYFEEIDEIPLTSNGKVNKKKLPMPSNAYLTEEEYIAPKNEVEKKLARIWGDILDIEEGKISTESDFFEIGGDSLKVQYMINAIHKAFGIRFELKVLYIQRSIEDIGKYIINSQEYNNRVLNDEYLISLKQINNIRKASTTGNYPIAYSQKRIYVQEQFEGIGTSYNILKAIKINGRLDKDKLESVFNQIIQRQESLRTAFIIDNEEIVQKVSETLSLKMEYVKISENELQKTIRDFNKPFNLNKPPLIRVKLIEFDATDFILLFNVHHIIFDGISFGILIDEFIQLYQNKELPKLNMQYKDYSQWSKLFEDSDRYKEQEKYWLNKFSANYQPLNMQTDFERSETRSFTGGSYTFTVSKDIVDKINRLAIRKTFTTHTILFAAYAIALSKLTNQKDITIGSLVSGRQLQDVQDIIGMFNNFLPIRNIIEPNDNFEKLLDTINQNIIEAYDNQDYSYDKIVDKLSLKLDKSRNPLFDTMLIFHNETSDTFKIELEDIEMLSYELDMEGTSKLDFKLDIVRGAKGELECCIEYNDSLFKEATMMKIANVFSRIVEFIADDSTIEYSHIDITSHEEKEMILTQFNNTYKEYLNSNYIHLQFEKQVQENPNKVAVIYQDTTISYGDLNKKVNQLARKLRNLGITNEKIVAIMADRSIEMMIGILAILKAGGAYMPIGVNYPIDRITYMIKDSQAEVILCDQSKVAFDLNMECIDLYDQSIYTGNDSNLEIINNPNDLAYVIYTSGSTGKPKGVMIEHHSLINRINWMDNSYTINEDDIVLQKTPYTFDVSVWELLWWATKGASVCMLVPDGEKDPEEIINTIEKHGVTIIHFVPSMLKIFLDYISSKEQQLKVRNLKWLFASGEVLKKEYVNQFNDIFSQLEDLKLVNLYGPTEATIDVSYFNCKRSKTEIVPIGKPINNTRFYVLDKYLNILPVGVAGELYIAGDGVARGYLNREALTNERFIDNPFEENNKMYKTGDIVKWLPDGNVEYIGRIDNQVKIRGFRIELGEIESKILEFGNITDAIVIDIEDEGGDKFLCGYFVADVEVSLLKLREYLLLGLPQYMIPSYFVQIDKIPLNDNGKIDRKLLPKPQMINNRESVYIAPRNNTESKLIDMWKGILNISEIGINDDFFDLGGHSLKATTLMLMITKEFKVSLSLKEIFDNSTVRDMAKRIGISNKSIYSTIEPISEREYYPLSVHQRRIFMLQEMAPSSTSYNIHNALIIEGEIDIRKIEESFMKLIDRHEALRTTFDYHEGEPVQIISDENHFELQYYKANHVEIDQLIYDVIQVFDFKKAPLLNVALIEIDRNKYVLVYDIHHIISDGISMQLLTREFIEVYQDKDLDALAFQYKDFCVWHDKFLNSDLLKSQEKYWLNVFSGSLPQLDMPTDYQRGAVQVFDGDSISFSFDHEITLMLNDISKSTGTTIFMVLMAVYNVLISLYSNQEDIIIGTPIAGRPIIDLENVVGMFVNTLAIRNDVSGDKSFSVFLNDVKDNMLSAFENQDYPFDYLVEKLGRAHGFGRNPLFDVAFTIQNIDAVSSDIDGLTIEQYKFNNNTSKFDLLLTGIETQDCINFVLEYNCTLFTVESMDVFINNYINLTKDIIADIDIKINELEINRQIDFAEYEEQDVDFNF